MSWYLAPALVKLRNEVNAKWPGRSKASDGTIGDARHSARLSDHNPNSRGSVNAMDVTARGISTAALIKAAKRHPSVRYIIHNRRIMNRDIGNFRPRRYTGSNPHTKHVHISLYQSATAENRTQSWGLATTSAPKRPKPKPKPKPVKARSFPLPSGHWYGVESSNPRNHSGYHRRDRAGIKTAQKRLLARGWAGIGKADGRYGPATQRVVRQFQAEKRIRVDGAIGAQTWAALWTEPVT